MKQFTYVVDFVQTTKARLDDGWSIMGAPFKQGSNPQKLQAFVIYYYPQYRHTIRERY